MPEWQRQRLAELLDPALAAALEGGRMTGRTIALCRICGHALSAHGPEGCTDWRVLERADAIMPCRCRKRSTAPPDPLASGKAER